MEIYDKDKIKELSWNELFNEGEEGGSNATPFSPGSSVITKERIVGSVLEGCTFKTAKSGARVEILKDPRYGMEMFDAYNNSIVKFLISGTNVGDFVLGDVDNDQYLQWDSSAGKLYVKGELTADVATIGGFTVQADHIRDVADTFGLSSVVTGGDDIRFWAGSTFANRNSAPFFITESGEVYANNITVAGGSVSAAILDGIIGLGNLDIATKGWSQTCVFSSTDADTVSWGAGVLTTASGDTYNISAGNTGNMVAKTYIYLDIAVSTTAYQTTTTASTAVGSGKILVAVAENETTSASYMLSETTQIVGDNILANTVTAGKLNVTTLSAITANLGTITAGNITLDSSGYIRAGATGYLTGTGFFLGYDTDAYKFSIGNPSGDNMKWDGTSLTVNDSTLSFQSVFGDGSDGNVTISADTSLSSDMYYDNLTINSTKTLTCNGYRIFVKNTLTNSGTIKQNGSNGVNGNISGAGGDGGAGTSAGSISGSPAGAAGSSGLQGVGSGRGADGTAGTNITKGVGVAGVKGGRGGGWPGGGYFGGTVGAAGTISGTIYNKINSQWSAYALFDIVPSLTQFTVSAGSSGGTGGGGAYPTYSPAGGGGGAGGTGGFCWISAKKIVNNASSYIQANGGNGGNGAVGAGGGGGGGAGGSGGVVIITYSSLTNNGTIEAKGGTGGTGGTGGGGDWTDGEDGNDGNDGKVIYIKQ